ncbi:hypothetical protein HOD75_03880 [archaeon]|jgi:hypothetical protein|nr:hypothetical protein [archaeon]MBT4242010.1 hypothetical protein [archaeon]MBT4418557.1 hypothetical protein [archaeon]
MINEIYQNVLYFLELSFDKNVLWIVFPLLIATIIMLFYFEKYKDEKPGWNTHVSNSLVLLFVAMILFRQIYNIDGLGMINFVENISKFVVSLVILLIGIIILFLNFEHFLPEKIARYVSSPLTLNLIAYVVILYVFSEIQDGWGIFISLLIIFALLIVILNLIRIPLRNLFEYIKKMKEKEKVEEIKGEKKPIHEKKKMIKKEEVLIRKEKKEKEKK